MKKLFSFIIAFALVHNIAFGQFGTSRLKVRQIDNKAVRVQINNGRILEAPDAVIFEQIPSGNHNIRIWTRSGRGAGNHFRLVYSGNLFIPEYSDVRTILNRNNLLKIHEIRPVTIPAGYNGIIPNHCGTIAPVDYGIEENTFCEILAAMDHTAFESTRIQIAVQAIHTHRSIRTDQVEALMRRMVFESGRLRIAKEAYFFTVDKEHYYRLFPLFCFDSSISELTRFMHGA